MLMTVLLNLMANVLTILYRFCCVRLQSLRSIVYVRCRFWWLHIRPSTHTWSWLRSRGSLFSLSIGKFLSHSAEILTVSNNNQRFVHVIRRCRWYSVCPDKSLPLISIVCVPSRQSRSFWALSVKGRIATPYTATTRVSFFCCAFHWQLFSCSRRVHTVSSTSFILRGGMLDKKFYSDSQRVHDATEGCLCCSHQMLWEASGWRYSIVIICLRQSGWLDLSAIRLWNTHVVILRPNFLRRTSSMLIAGATVAMSRNTNLRKINSWSLLGAITSVALWPHLSFVLDTSQEASFNRLIILLHSFAFRPDGQGLLWVFIVALLMWLSFVCKIVVRCSLGLLLQDWVLCFPEVYSFEVYGAT